MIDLLDDVARHLGGSGETKPGWGDERARPSNTKLPSRVRRFSFASFRPSKSHDSTSASALRNHSQTDNVSTGKKENRMLLDLRGRDGRTDRLRFSCQATVLPLMISILATIVSCSGPGADMPPPSLGIMELFSGSVSGTPTQQSVQRDEAHPEVRRGQPKAPASSKVATDDGQKTNGRPVPRPASKKAGAPPSPDVQREQQLYQEFLEWRNRQRDQQ